MSISTDADYNAKSRYLEMSIVIYFKDLEPLRITRDDFLVSIDLLEETETAGITLFNDASSNEVTIELVSPNRIFTPTNEESIYYGKMTKGTRIDIFIRPIRTEALEWDMLGKYYVTGWKAEITGLIATVTVNDNMLNVFEMPDVFFPIMKELQVNTFFQHFFSYLDIPVEIDSSLNTILPYAYIKEDNKNFLSSLCKGTQSRCFCTHDGNIKVKNWHVDVALRATITDNDQIKTANVESSISTTYNGISITYNIPQESAQSTILNIKENLVIPGETEYQKITLSKKPLYKFVASLISKSSSVTIKNINATTATISFTLVSKASYDVVVDIEFLGTYLEVIKTTLTDDTDALLSIDNIYIQTESQADTLKTQLLPYVQGIIPVLKLEIRGNPLFELGDKIRVTSAKYKLDFTGRLIRASYNYNGALSCTITLLNVIILGGTPI